MDVRWEQQGPTWYGVAEGEDSHFATVRLDGDGWRWRHWSGREGTTAGRPAAQGMAELVELRDRCHRRFQSTKGGVCATAG